MRCSSKAVADEQQLTVQSRVQCTAFWCTVQITVYNSFLYSVHQSAIQSRVRCTTVNCTFNSTVHNSFFVQSRVHCKTVACTVWRTLERSRDPACDLPAPQCKTSRAPGRSLLHPQHYTLNTTQYNLVTTTSTLHNTPSLVHSQHYTLNNIP